MSDYQEHVLPVYQVIDEHFSSIRQQSKWDYIEEFLDRFPEPAQVCDIGCGNGRNMRSNCFGIDNCPNFIQICHEKGLPAKISSMTDLDLEDQSFEAIICIAAFHHLDSEEQRIKTLEEMKRILKPGGRALISVWSLQQQENSKRQFQLGHNLVPWNQKGKIYQRYYYIFDPEEIKNLFQKTGFELISEKWSYGNEVFEIQKPRQD